VNSDLRIRCSKFFHSKTRQ